MRCTKCGRILRKEEVSCPLCGTPAAAPKSASGGSPNRQTVRIAARRKNIASTQSSSSPVLDEVFSALSIRFRDSSKSAPDEPPAEPPKKARVVPVRRTRTAPQEQQSAPMIAAVNSILNGQSIPTGSLETAEDEADEVVLPEQLLEEPIMEADEEEAELADEPVEEPVAESGEEEVELADEPVEEPVAESGEEEAELADEPVEEPVAESDEEEAEETDIPIFKTPELIEDAIAAISASVAGKLFFPEEAENATVEPIEQPEEAEGEPLAGMVEALMNVCAEIQAAEPDEPVEQPEEAESEPSADMVEALMNVCAETQAAEPDEPVEQSEEAESEPLADMVEPLADMVEALMNACAEIQADEPDEPVEQPEEAESEPSADTVEALMNACAEIQAAEPDEPVEQPEEAEGEPLADMVEALMNDCAETPSDEIDSTQVGQAESSDELAGIWNLFSSVPDAEGCDSAEQPISEPVFLEEDPERDALTDSIAAAVAAAVSVSVIPHEPPVTSDSVSDDTDPLELPEEVKAMLPDVEPLTPQDAAPEQSEAPEQTTEEDTMKAVAKKIRKPNRFRFAYIVPALILALVCLAGSILYTINSLLTPIEMPEKPAQQQAADTEQKDADTPEKSEGNDTACVDGLYFIL